MSDLLDTPPTDTPYAVLKNRLIESHSESEESRIRTLLQGVELGDSRPSHLLTRMRSLAGSSVGEPLLKSLWLARLPMTTRSIVGALSEDLSKLAAVADKIHDLSPSPQVNAATSSASSAHNSSLEAKIEQLSQQMNELASIVNRRERSGHSKFSSRNRSRSRGRFKEPANNMCFYHTNFGARAKKCNSPCSFQNSEN